MNQQKLYKLGIPFILFCIMLIAFLIRIIPEHIAIKGNYVNFFEQDPYYHLRRVFLALQHPFSIPDYDSYSGYPQGLHCFWPAFFDQFIAITAWLIGFGNPNRFTVEKVAAFIPPIFGALTIIPIYLLTKEIFSRKIALLTSLFYALLPGHIYWTIIGRPDHHCAEPIFPLLMFWSLLVAIRSQGSEVRNQKSENNLPAAYRLLPTIFSGIMLVCSLLVWTGATIFIGILAFYLVIIILIAHGDKQKQRIITKINVTLFSTALILLIPICATTYWGRRFLVAYDALSWFHIFLAAGLLIAFIYLGFLSQWLSHKSRVWFLLASFLSLILLFALALAFFPTFFTNFEQGFGWILKSDPWLKTITEFQPLFISLGVFSTFRPTSLFGYGFYILPLVFWIIFYRLIRSQKFTRRSFSEVRSEVRSLPDEALAKSGQKSEFAVLWFFIFLVCIGTLGIIQSRFSHFLSYLVAVGYAFLTLILIEKIKVILDFIKSRTLSLVPSTFNQPTAYAPTLKLWSAGGCLLLTGLLLWILLKPCINEIRSLPAKYAGLPNEWRDTLVWIRDNTPPTRSYNNPSRTPEYGILTPWVAGHWLNYVANRPNICNGFHTDGENNRAGMRFYLSESEAETNSILDDTHARYFILTDITPNMLDYGNVIGIDASEYIYRLVRYPPQGGTQIAFLPTQRFYQLISSKLYIFDGIDDSGVPLASYRLVYETPSRWNFDNYNVSCLKVFEKVKGATLTGNVIPGTLVRISVPIITNTGREFAYKTVVKADYTGTYKVTVPYSTVECPYSTHGKTAYTISWMKLKKPILVNVNEKQVLKGETISIENRR